MSDVAWLVRPEQLVLEGWSPPKQVVFNLLGARRIPTNKELAHNQHVTIKVVATVRSVRLGQEGDTMVKAYDLLLLLAEIE